MRACRPMSSDPAVAPDPAPDRRGFLQRHWKKLVAGVVGVIVLVLAASFIYAKVINDAPDEFDAGDLTDALADTIPGGTQPAAAEATVVPASPGPSSAATDTTAPAAATYSSAP